MPNVTPERLERRSLRQLLQGDPAKAEVAARKLIERSPQCASGWAALKGALTARGLPADADALRGCLASPPSAAAEGPIDLLASRRLSPRGLIFDPAEPVPLRRMAARLAQVRTAADLRETDNAVWFADRGGEWVERDPVLDLGDAAGPPVPVRYATAPKFLASIRNAAVVGEGLALTEAGEFLEELHPPFKASKYAARRHGDELMFEPAPRGRGQLSVKAFDTPAFLMAGPTDTSFGDFLVNFAPRLSLYEAAGLDCPILVRWKPLPQVLSILEALGFGADRVIFHTTDQISLFPKLFVSCWPSENKAAPGWRRRRIDPCSIWTVAMFARGRWPMKSRSASFSPHAGSRSSIQAISPSSRRAACSPIPPAWRVPSVRPSTIWCSAAITPPAWS